MLGVQQDLKRLNQSVATPPGAASAMSAPVRIPGWAGEQWRNFLGCVETAALTPEQLPPGERIAFFLVTTHDLQLEKITGQKEIGAVTGAASGGAPASIFASHLPDGGSVAGLRVETSAGVRAAGVPVKLFFAIAG